MWVLVNVWPRETPYPDGGWSHVYGPFDSAEAAQSWAAEHRAHDGFIFELTSPEHGLAEGDEE